MLKGKQKVKRGENQNLFHFVKGGLVMSRNILAGLVVLTLVLWGSTAMADCGNALSYQVFTDMAKNTATVKVYLANDAGIAGGSIPISFSALGSDIQCTKIDFTGSRVENFQLYPQIDNQNKRVLIGMIRALNEDIDDVLKPGDGLLATMNFPQRTATCLNLSSAPGNCPAESFIMTWWMKKEIRFAIRSDRMQISRFPSKPVEQAMQPNPYLPVSAWNRTTPIHSTRRR